MLSDVQADPNGRPLYLDCLVPSLGRLAGIEYSVFAKGTHCQWHARVVSCLAATFSYFIDSQSVPVEHKEAVSIAVLGLARFLDITPYHC